ncbi:MAG TPA: O-antigen ligase family protein [Bacteroidia bacterium]|nr:O-antigen ligase family protein [Bacteroidia bacterium]
MKKQHIHANIHFYLSVLIAFLLPLARYVPVIIILLTLNWLIEGDFKAKLKKIAASKIALVFILFYILHLLGLLYTANMRSGNFDIQVKLSLLIFPLLYTSRPLANKQVQQVFIALICGSLLCSALLLIHAVSSYYTTGENNFFYEAFTNHVIHPSYLAMYLNVAVCWLLIQLKKNSQELGRFTIILSLLIIFYFTFILVLLSSKLGLLTLVLICFSALIYYSCKNYKAGIAGIILTIVAGLAIIKFVPAVSNRIQVAAEALMAPTTNNTDAESTAVRMLIWKAANQVIAENLLIGVGTGDAKDELIKEYERRGMTGAIKNQLNAHNEFYQVFVSIGLLGFLVFCIQLIVPLIVSIKEKNAIYTFFIIIMILNFLTESMLEAEAGVMFYAFFNSVLCFTFIPHK